MASIWRSGKRKNDERTTEANNRNRNPGDHRNHHEPDERTRLLAGETSHEGYLSPDDPAVSPYNLWSIRALRACSTLFLGITFIWWVFLLVSIFISPPLMYNRGSGFTDFSYTTLTVSNLLISLVFFAVPSRPMIVWNGVLALLLVVDMIIILCVPRVRLEEGAVGIASVVWAAVISIYNVAQVYAVQKGKEEEEERLTGRVEYRRTLLQWAAVMAETIILGVVTLVAVLLTAMLILRASDASLEAPGNKYLVNNGKYEVHLACVGNITYYYYDVDSDDFNNDGDGGKKNKKKKTPTILIEAGEGPSEHSLQPFIHDAYLNGTIDRYCYWDRPGFAWSDNAPSPHSAGMSADALSEALALAGEEGPWVLVSAGIGSIYSRIFASRHIHDISGLFMIDPTHEDELQRQIGKPDRGFVLWGRGIMSPLGLDRLAGAIFKRRTREDRIFGKVAYQGGRFIKAKLQENIVAESITTSEIASARNIQTPETPLVVVSSGNEIRKSETWASQQEKLTQITDNLVAWDVVRNAPHEVWTIDEGRQTLEKRLVELLRLF